MLFVILAILIGLGVLIAYKMDTEETSGLFCILIAIILVIATVFFIVGAFVHVSQASIIDEKIAMYEEENQRIEASITAVVENYQQYETDIFKDVSESHSESSMILVTMYPELKSDALVQEQITIYTANNEKIKQLKEERINASVWRWWLYFGH